MCSDALSLDACRSKCVSHGFTIASLSRGVQARGVKTDLVATRKEKLRLICMNLGVIRQDLERSKVHQNDLGYMFTCPDLDLAIFELRYSSPKPCQI